MRVIERQFNFCDYLELFILIRSLSFNDDDLGFVFFERFFLNIYNYCINS